MTEPLSEAHHPAPQRDRIDSAALAFILLAGPLSWFGQLNASFIASSQSCFKAGERLTALQTGPMIFGIAVYLLCLALALVAAAVSRALLQRVKREVAESHDEMLESGRGRTHFLATCGLYLDLGFALVIAVNLVALLMVPTCVA